jgi:UDP-N-acetylglucosamine diphosphorylase / glucose-1-phosphate thymidylyltransferase / UDP-N-acetylgalactosamine diphosphorylase / glucosamine-1-phosphate N-acetyltransferase / galactosamine-1-phosphate N-acetyltransferase
MKIVLNDTSVRAGLYPFGIISPVSSIRVGILTIKEKWERITGSEVFESTESFLDTVNDKNEKPDLLIDSTIIPSKIWWQQLQQNPAFGSKEINPADSNNVKTINHPWQIFQLNDWAIRQDYDLITTGRNSQPISSTNKTIAPQNIFIEEGARVEHSIINASTGPVYIGKNAEIMESCSIRGPFAIGEGAVLKMGTKVYGATTLGPYCMGGGEIKNSVLFGYSNKAHDGYLGDSVLGEWCNLGAGTSNSNIKNTAGVVKLWNNETQNYLPAGLKAGLIMGDYSRSAINTSFNTGTVVGICCNVFGEGFPPKFISDFTWGKERYTFAKIVEDINNWKQLKNKSITEREIEILKKLYNQKTNQQ